MENILALLCSRHVILEWKVASSISYCHSLLFLAHAVGIDHHHSHQVSLLHTYWIISEGILGGCHSENAQLYPMLPADCGGKFSSMLRQRPTFRLFRRHFLFLKASSLPSIFDVSISALHLHVNNNSKKSLFFSSGTEYLEFPYAEMSMSGGRLSYFYCQFFPN